MTTIYLCPVCGDEVNIHKGQCTHEKLLLEIKDMLQKRIDEKDAEIAKLRKALEDVSAYDKFGVYSRQDCALIARAALEGK